MKIIAGLTIVVGAIIMLTTPLYFLPALAAEHTPNSDLSSDIFRASVPLAWVHFFAGFFVLLLGIFTGRDKGKPKSKDYS
jgi:hypothetical protein